MSWFYKILERALSLVMLSTLWDLDRLQGVLIEYDFLPDMPFTEILQTALSFMFGVIYSPFRVDISIYHAFQKYLNPLKFFSGDFMK